MPLRSEALAEADEEDALPAAEAETPLGERNPLGSSPEQKAEQLLAARLLERDEALEEGADVTEKAVLALVDADEAVLAGGHERDPARGVGARDSVRDLVRHVDDDERR